MSHPHWGLIPLLLATTAVGSCSKVSEGGGDAKVLLNPVVIHVAGMQKGQGGKT